jgi:hypothetical protein
VPGKTTTIPHEVRRAIEQAAGLIATHPNVTSVSSPQLTEDAGTTTITVDLRLGLPFAWMASGISPNGVRAVEPVEFSFPHNYPINAPTITLREDFDRSLAHVQPGPPDGPVMPCLVVGNLDEFLHARGLLAIVDQLVAWLEKAAQGKLIDPSQGWEPIRRDGLVDWIIADGDSLRGLVSRREQHHFFTFHYLKFAPSAPLQHSRKSYLLHGEVGTEPIAVSKRRFGELLWSRSADGVNVRGVSIAIVVTPGKLPSGALHIAARYTPETVSNLRQLEERAREYGCGNSFKSALSYLRQCASEWQGRYDSPVVVILCCRRPYRLLGESSNIELVPYLVEIQAPALFPAGEETPVYPAAHRDAITPPLLQRFSGVVPAPEGRQLTMVGCGSLGSKIALHLARSGAAPSVVIDKNALSPHNAARHGLVPHAQDLQLTWLGPKAQALAEAIKGFGQSVQAFNEDVTRATGDARIRRQFFPRPTWAILNTTASLRVREALASMAPDQLSVRVIETCLFANGTLGLLTIEGPGRNPNSMDLIATAYEIFRTEEQWRSVVFEAEDSIQWHSVGQGCGSTTMQVSDARISLHAASMTECLTRLRLEGLPEDGGRVYVGIVSNDGMNLNWSMITVPPAHLTRPDNAPSWTVRVADKAHQKIPDSPGFSGKSLSYRYC